jgi:hypothetical protein
MATKTAGIAVCAVLVMVSVGWAQNTTAPKKFHTSSPRPHHPLKDVGEGHQHSGAASVVSPKTETVRRSEVERLEHQNSNRLQAQARQTGVKKNGQTAKIRTEPATKSSSINFNYRPPRTQSTGTSSGHKH